MRSERVPLQVANNRRSLRLRGFDYARPGTYFVTIRLRGSAHLFGEVVAGRMRLNAAGRVARQCSRGIPKHFSTVTLDTFVVMPDHMHGIIVIGKSPGERNVGAQHAAPLPLRTRLSATSQDSAPASGSLGAIVRSFKSAATKRINELRHSPGEPVWQRNYYDRVIRSDDAAHVPQHRIHQAPAFDDGPAYDEPGLSG